MLMPSPDDPAAAHSAICHVEGVGVARPPVLDDEQRFPPAGPAGTRSRHRPAPSEVWLNTLSSSASTSAEPGPLVRSAPYRAGLVVRQVDLGRRAPGPRPAPARSAPARPPPSPASARATSPSRSDRRWPRKPGGRPSPRARRGRPVSRVRSRRGRRAARPAVAARSPASAAGGRGRRLRRRSPLEQHLDPVDELAAGPPRGARTCGRRAVDPGRGARPGRSLLPQRPLACRASAAMGRTNDRPSRLASSTAPSQQHQPERQQDRPRLRATPDSEAGGRHTSISRSDRGAVGERAAPLRARPAPGSARRPRRRRPWPGRSLRASSYAGVLARRRA